MDNVKNVLIDKEENEDEFVDCLDENELKNSLTSYEICNIRGHTGYINDADFYENNSNFVITSNFISIFITLLMLFLNSFG